jgi:hypothetical protein
MSSSISEEAAFGGQAHVPSSFCTGILNFISMEKEFNRAEIFNNR